MQWQVHAESHEGVVFTCGLTAPDYRSAVAAVTEAIPFIPAVAEVTEITDFPNRAHRKRVAAPAELQRAIRENA